MAKIPPQYLHTPSTSWYVREREAAYDNQWLEAGVYRFICTHCDEIVSSREPRVYEHREFLTCPKCKNRNRI